MARTEEQIVSDLAASVESIDPTLDVHKGPFLGSYITPFSSEIQDAETKVDVLGQLYSTSFVATQDSDTIARYGENHGIGRGEGEVSTGYVYFFTYTPPVSGDTAIVPQGAIVSDRDGVYAYRVVYQATMYGSRAASYYNAAKRWYEIRVQVEALGSGDAYDLPPQRIQRILSDVPNFSGVWQYSYVSGGTPIETDTDYMERIDTKLHGLALGSMGGIESTARNYDPSAITDAVVVYSSDIGLFTRPTSRPALDIYIIGEILKEYEQTYTSAGLETDIALTKVPVHSITSVYVNGALVSNYEFLPDTSSEYGTSAEAEDIIRFDTALVAGDEVVITYMYNSLISDLNTYLNQPKILLFETEVLVREGIPVGIETQIVVTLLSTYDPQLAESSVLSALNSYLNAGKYRELSYPDELRTAISSQVPYATKIQVTTFKRHDTGILEVEVVELDKNQYPYTSSLSAHA